MDNLGRMAAMVEIRHCMMIEDGYLEIDSKRRYRIETDILGRYEQVRFTTTISLFCANYINWVKRYIYDEGADSWMMWEKWADMLKDLYTVKR